jgi:acyl carrier protein
MMTSNELRSAVTDCISQSVGQPMDGINLGVDLGSMGLDSLSMLRLQMILEERFALKTVDDFDIDATTGEDLVAYVAIKLRSRLQ